MPNSIAYLVLLAWPVVAAVLFLTQPRKIAILLTLVGGYMFLANGALINLPALPPIDKRNMPVLAALTMCLLGLGAGAVRRGRRRRMRDAQAVDVVSDDRPGWLPETAVGRALLVAVVVFSFLTALLNGDPQRFGNRMLPGLTLWDALSHVLNKTMLILPFLMGRRYLATPRDHQVVLGVLVVIGLVYSLPTLFEIRMYPILHEWIYGFNPVPWRQIQREGGWRPIVFMEHGLRLAILMAMMLGAAAALSRCLSGARRWMAIGAAVWLATVLILSRSLGAVIIATAIVPVILFLGRRLQLLAAAVIALTVLTYPALRGSGLLSEASITSTLEPIAGAKVDSLRFRLINEDMLLEKAAQRPLFGWGTWGRWLVFDPETGRKSSIPDGIWVITLGEFGWVGYIGHFGMLTAPIFWLYLRRRGWDPPVATTGLCLVLCINIFDMLPNSSLTPVSWLIAGALMGDVERRVAATRPRRRRSLQVSGQVLAPGGSPQLARREGGLRSAHQNAANP